MGDNRRPKIFPVPAHPGPWVLVELHQHLCGKVQRVCAMGGHENLDLEGVAGRETCLPKLKRMGNGSLCSDVIQSGLGVQGEGCLQGPTSQVSSTQ